MVDLEGGPAEPLIVKVFRTLQHGDNPDVVVQSALTREGSDRVPMAIGHLSGAWDAPGGSGLEHGDLAFAQEFIPGVEDAWRVALVAAAAGHDFTARARDLGVVTAQIHAALAHALGTRRGHRRRPRRARRVDALEVCRGDGSRARARLPLGGRRARHRVRARRELACAATDPRRLPPRPGPRRARARLGRARLRGRAAAPARRAGPARPHPSRRRRHAPLVRLRRRLGRTRRRRPSTPPRWAAACRVAFLEGYASVAGPADADDVALVQALELDKALYEVVYEARNRPTWLPIPLGAVERLTTEEGTP